jgi:hypothetical protein
MFGFTTLSALATLGAYSPGVLIPHVATARGEMKLLQVRIIGSAVCSVSVHVNHLVDMSIYDGGWDPTDI